MRRPRGGRKAKFGKHISISARDPEWDAVRRNAELRRLTIARYLVWLVERDAACGEPMGPVLALDRDEQRELLAAVREIRALLLEGADAAPLVADMQERIAIRFNAWVSAMAGSGRLDEVREALQAVLGEDRADAVTARIAPSPPEARTSGERDEDDDPEQ